MLWWAWFITGSILLACKAIASCQTAGCLLLVVPACCSGLCCCRAVSIHCGVKQARSVQANLAVPEAKLYCVHHCCACQHMWHSRLSDVQCTMTPECASHIYMLPPLVLLVQQPGTRGIPTVAAVDSGRMLLSLDVQMEQIQAAETTSRKIVKETPGAPNAPPRLTDECRVLADVAEPPNMKRAFETTLSAALLESQLSSLESKTGLAMLNRDKKGNAQSVTLTGWTAIAGMAAMVVLVIAGGTFAWKRYHGMPDATTVVLKSKPRYNRVATSDR